MAPDDDHPAFEALAVKPDGDEGNDAEIIDLARQRDARVEIGRLLSLAREIDPDDPMSVIDEWDRKSRDMELAEQAMLEHGGALPLGDPAGAKVDTHRAVRIPEDIMKRIDALVPYVRASAALGAGGRVSVAAVARLALLRGLAMLEAESRET